MDTRKVLIAEDDSSVRKAVQRVLELENYQVTAVNDGQAALEALSKSRFDLAVLDVMMPFADGLTVCKEARHRGIDVPILLLTARVEVGDRVAGLDAGADDYMTKPFSTRELVSRIKAVLRRANALSGEKVIDANGLMLDPVSQRVSFGNSILEMGPTEYRLLAFFMTHPERAYTRAQLLDQVWGGNVYIEDRTIDVHIRRLRKVLEPFGVDRFVQTVRGTGYRFSTRADLAAG